MFIFDLQALSPYPSGKVRAKDAQLSETGRRALTRLFRDPKIIKLGWDLFESDIPMLRTTAQGYFNASFSDVHGILDLQQYVAAYKSAYNFEDNVRGLAHCSEYFLGRRVNKLHQMSDWSLRPLGSSQLNYAALDAHSLLAVLDATQICLGDAALTGTSLSLYPSPVLDHIRGLHETLNSHDKDRMLHHRRVSDATMEEYSTHVPITIAGSLTRREATIYVPAPDVIAGEPHLLDIGDIRLHEAEVTALSSNVRSVAVATAAGVDLTKGGNEKNFGSEKKKLADWKTFIATSVTYSAAKNEKETSMTNEMDDDNKSNGEDSSSSAVKKKK